MFAPDQIPDTAPSDAESAINIQQSVINTVKNVLVKMGVSIEDVTASVILFKINRYSFVIKATSDRRWVSLELPRFLSAEGIVPESIVTKLINFADQWPIGMVAFDGKLFTAKIPLFIHFPDNLPETLFDAAHQLVGLAKGFKAELCN